MTSRIAALCLILSYSASAQDAGIKTPIYEIGEDARISIGFGEAVPVPPGYYFPLPAFQKIDNEMRRLHYIEAHPPAQESVGAQGFLIALAAGLIAGLAVGAGLTYAATRIAK